MKQDLVDANCLNRGVKVEVQNTGRLQAIQALDKDQTGWSRTAIRFGKSGKVLAATRKVIELACVILYDVKLGDGGAKVGSGWR